MLPTAWAQVAVPQDPQRLVLPGVQCSTQGTHVKAGAEKPMEITGIHEEIHQLPWWKSGSMWDSQIMGIPKPTTPAFQ